jgi:hypothetical protein
MLILGGSQREIISDVSRETPLARGSAVSYAAVVLLPEQSCRGCGRLYWLPFLLLWEIGRAHV